MATASDKRKARQRQAGFRLLILAAILICLNMLAARFHYAIDLTREKRFTLTRSTKELLGNMKDVAVIDVYLEGSNLPAGFQRLKESVRERLQSFREVGGSRIVFRFTDPFEGKAEKEKGEVYQHLADKGIEGMRIRQNKDESYEEQIVFPFALVSYRGKEMPVRLMENHLGMSALEVLNYSESLLEYKLASAIHQLAQPAKPDIAYLMGNGEALGVHTYDALTTLGKLYEMDTLDINDGVHIPAVYKAVVICKPTEPFDEKQKYKLDQYVMKGGHILWLVDAVHASMDSFGQGSQQFIATDYSLNLDDQLFKYGVRINSDLIEDLQCNRIPFVVGMNGDQPQIELRGWFYFPVFVPTSRHPIVNNMDGVMGAFVSSIDTIANGEIKKTVLLESSQYSRVAMAPARVSLSMLNFPPRPELYNKPFRPAAVLLEGKFQSVFQDRMHPEFLKLMRDSLKQPFKPVADTAGAMIVIADGDMFFNDFSRSQGPLEMGYWQYDKVRYANKSFMLNCLEYLTDPGSLLEARSKDVRLRLLDGGRVKQERTKWQAVNALVPIGLVLIFAACYLFFRKRRYEGA